MTTGSETSKGRTIAGVPCVSYTDTDSEQSEDYEFSLGDFRVVVAFVATGTLLGLLFDHFSIFGFLPEGIVRALAGTADTLGFAFLGLIGFRLLKKHPHKTVISTHIWFFQLEFSRNKISKYNTWAAGGLMGLALAFTLQALVFSSSNDPHSLIGVIYAFGFSNLDNTMAGLLVLAIVLKNYSWQRGLKAYMRHPFYLGNFVMVIVIPLVSLAVRAITGFRPELNSLAGLESGVMDVDSIGAFVIYFLLTRKLGWCIPQLNDNYSIELTGRFPFIHISLGETQN